MPPLVHRLLMLAGSLFQELLLRQPLLLQLELAQLLCEPSCPQQLHQ
jgi:hypothetical protein